MTDIQDAEGVDEEERRAVAETYAARARVLLQPGVDQNDFVRVLDALADELTKMDEAGAAEAASDLASAFDLLPR